MNLHELKRRAGLTNAAIGKQLGCSASKAGMIMQGRHISVYTDREIQQLADILSVTFERCWMAMCESYDQFMGPGRVHRRYDERRADAQAELGLPVEHARQLATIEAGTPVPFDHSLIRHDEY